jgi:hypothetical protein
MDVTAAEERQKRPETPTRLRFLFLPGIPVQGTLKLLMS